MPGESATVWSDRMARRSSSTVLTVTAPPCGETGGADASAADGRTTTRGLLRGGTSEGGAGDRWQEHKKAPTTTRHAKRLSTFASRATDFIAAVPFVTSSPPR